MKHSIIHRVAALAGVGVCLGIAQVANAAWQAGLQEGTLTGCNPSIDKTSYPETWTAVGGPVMVTKNEYGHYWETKVYKGQIYLDGSTYWFCEKTWSHSYLKIDNEVLIENPNWWDTTIKSITKEAGWYDFEFRLWTPVNDPMGHAGLMDINGKECGLGYVKQEAAPTGMNQCLYPEDDGQMRIFRYDDGLGFSSINVRGDPIEIGTPDPNYGMFTNVVVGQSYTFTCPSAWTNEDQTIGAICKGYRLTLANGVEIVGTGLSTSIVYSAELAGSSLAWLWDVRYKVTADAKGGGSVTNAQEWVQHGAKFNSRAVSDAGKLFRKWTNADGTTIGTAADLSLTVSAPLTSIAWFSGARAYVTTNVAKTAVFPYDTWDTAAHDLQAALAAWSDEVIVGDGTFENTVYEHTISRAVNLHSLNGPKATTLKRRSSGDGRHFTVENNSSTINTVISGFTLDGGQGGFNTYSCFSIAAGVISNCVIKGKFSDGYGCYSQVSGSGKVLDCEFDASDNGYISSPIDGSYWLLQISGSAVADRCIFHGYHVNSGANAMAFNRSAVYVCGGTLRNSLVYDCSIGKDTVVENLSGGGVRVDRGNVVNCTVAGCTAWGNGGGILMKGGSVRNCIVWGNEKKGTAGDDICANGLSDGNVLYTCASDVGDETAIPAAAQGAGCIAANPIFHRAARHDYRLKADSPCLEAGDSTAYPSATGFYDIRRLPRQVNDCVDMGCYEMNLHGTVFFIR